jgi:mRNA interferase MazF
VICAPVYTRRDGLATQVEVGVEDGFKHESSIHCDALVSLPKAMLTDYVSSLRPARLRALDQALRVALALA